MCGDLVFTTTLRKDHHTEEGRTDSCVVTLCSPQHSGKISTLFGVLVEIYLSFYVFRWQVAGQFSFGKMYRRLEFKRDFENFLD